MTETTAASRTTPTTTSPGGAPNRLETDRGTTTIAEGVVTKVAGIAAREVGGEH